MIKLIGVRREYGLGQGSIVMEEEIIAEFHFEEDAKEYIAKSKLKQPRWPDKMFRQTSLLQGYQEAWLELVEMPKVIPVNPII